MSYNITSQKTKRLENLKISIENLATAFKDDNLEFNQNADNTVTYSFGCEQEITGHLDFPTDVLSVTDIRLFGDGSGWAFRQLETVFKKSTGYFEAVFIWEGGDAISHFIVNEGTVTDTEIEL